MRDNGVGIPLEQQQRIFEPFFQAANITGGGVAEPRSYMGAGLGLVTHFSLPRSWFRYLRFFFFILQSISKKFIELMDGQISCVSEIGEGCVIRFRISLDMGMRRSSEMTFVDV